MDPEATGAGSWLAPADVAEKLPLPFADSCISSHDVYALSRALERRGISTKGVGDFGTSLLDLASSRARTVSAGSAKVGAALVRRVLTLKGVSGSAVAGGEAGS